MLLSRINVPGFLRGNLDMRNLSAWTTLDGMTVLFSEDITPKWGWLKHASVARPDRYPSWDEILAVKEQLFGDIDCMMVLPKKADYVNVHENAFHIWQCPEGWGIQ